MLYFGDLAVRHSYRYPVHPYIRAASAKAFLHSKPQYLPKYLFIPTNFKMKTIFPIAFALFGAALAAPVQPQGADSDKRSPVQNADILYNNQAGWGKREAAQNADILYNNQAGWGKKREAAQNADILYNNQAGWGKRSDA